VGQLPRRLRTWTPSLRSRILLTFGLGALGLSALLSVTTYNFAKNNLLEQRDRATVDRAYSNARRLLSDLRSNPTSTQDVLDRLGAERPLLNYRDEWTLSDARFGPDAVPDPLLSRVASDRTAARMMTENADTTVLAIGIPLVEVDASYFEFPSFDEVASTLRSVQLSLLLASIITTISGMAFGTVAARRAVKPLTAASQAAKAIAGGSLDTRLETADDPDLRVLTDSFNDMASALESRVERDARFASDVSHELRSPLMTLAASVEVMQARREEMPERAQAALDLLVADVARFQGLVEDLLEISRFDAGAIRLHEEPLLVGEFVRQAVAVSSLADTPVRVDEPAERLIVVGDRRRLARVVANLIDNARIHGGGEVTVEVLAAPHEMVESDTTADDESDEGGVRIVVEDHGPGVPVDERALIFERFARGGVAGRRASSEGAGLGLALVDEHVRLHGGQVWVEDRSDGDAGARFVIHLPATDIDAPAPGHSDSPIDPLVTEHP
jgi:two-component system, OmpR family, sensor histidine kinase MtrB